MQQEPRHRYREPGVVALRSTVDLPAIPVYHYGMEDVHTITMDAAGRLVIPAAVRRELALAGGTELIVEVHGGALHLRPAARGGVTARGRRLVVTSALTGAMPDHRDLRDERDDRIVGR